MDNNGTPIQTNKFYANLFLGDQTDSVFTFPYVVWWLKENYYGLGISYTPSSGKVFGNWDNGVAGYYINPLDVGSIVLSSPSFSKSNIRLDVTEMQHMSALATLSTGSSENFLDIPLVQGMGFVTGIYNGDLAAQIDSEVGFRSLSRESSTSIPQGVVKYRATLNNNVDWLIYVTLPENQDAASFSLSAQSSYSLTANRAVDGLVVQISVDPSSESDVYYDLAVGMYPVSVDLLGTAENNVATYTLSYQTEGMSLGGSSLVFCLPHHVDSMVSLENATPLVLDSTTKGTMTGFLSNQIVMSEPLNPDVQFLPQGSYDSQALQLMAQVANSELAVDIKSTIASLNSNYYAGKYIDKYAYILLVVSQILKDEEVTLQTLDALKATFDVFTSNSQTVPLMYDTRFGGVTSQGAQNGDPMADFGAPYYNDHHFHYGYFVHAAAVVGLVDSQLGGTWAADNREWVNSLIRDVANPSAEDSQFPVSRMFDWFHGHSWAAGLFAAGDGKNEESSSEDYNFAYGMKLWGQVVNDSSMQIRGDLMLSIMKRSMNMYYLYSDDNTVQPAEIIGNRVAGILFENKIDHTTYFGTNTEYIQGIHMLPITPASTVVRGSTFVEQEWNSKISPIIDSVNSGWTGVLRLNQALFDASGSYAFFSASDFDSAHLDNGQSRTWALAFSGGRA